MSTSERKTAERLQAITLREQGRTPPLEEILSTFRLASQASLSYKDAFGLALLLLAD